MRDRWYRKGGGNKYDPQIGAAATANADVARQTQAFNEQYFNDFVKPSMAQMVKESEINIGQQGKLFDLNYSQAQLQDERYRKLGIPAEDRYYKMVDDYSSEDEQEQQARSAIGDVRVAQQGQQQQLARRNQGLGIDPTSPAAIQARNDAAILNTATEAGAATRAREGAKALGMQLSSDAANFGRGGQSGILQFGAGAGANSSAGLQGAVQAGQVAPGGVAGVNDASKIASSAYGQNLSSFTSRANTLTQTAAQNSALGGIGQLAGTLGSAAIRQGMFGSDRRIKKHIVRLATLAHDIGLWAFHYIWDADDAPFHFGYMADEVEPVFPDAVLTGPGGYKMVDYDKVLV